MQIFLQFTRKKRTKPELRTKAKQGNKEIAGRSSPNRPQPKETEVGEPFQKRGKGKKRYAPRGRTNMGRGGLVGRMRAADGGRKVCPCERPWSSGAAKNLIHRVRKRRAFRNTGTTCPEKKSWGKRQTGLVYSRMPSKESFAQGRGEMETSRGVKKSTTTGKGG